MKQQFMIRSFLLLSLFGQGHAMADSVTLAETHAQLDEGVLLGQPYVLDPTVPPSENFEIIDWYLTLPIDSDKNGKADIVYEKQLANGFTFKPVFYTAEDGGMVFLVRITAPKLLKIQNMFVPNYVRCFVEGTLGLRHKA